MFTLGLCVGSNLAVGTVEHTHLCIDFSRLFVLIRFIYEYRKSISIWQHRKYFFNLSKCVNHQHTRTNDETKRTTTQRQPPVFFFFLSLLLLFFFYWFDSLLLLLLSVVVYTFYNFTLSWFYSHSMHIHNGYYLGFKYFRL